MITIKKDDSCTRTYVVNGKYIEHIYFYKDGEILFHTRRSWLENVDEEFNTSHCGDLIEITLDGEKVARANKLNLNRKDNFLFKMPSNWYLNSGYSLFIHVDNFLESWEGLPKKYDENKKHYLYGFKVKLKHPAKKYEMYLKYYKQGEEIEPEDRRKQFYSVVLKDETGKPRRDADGKYMHDETMQYCARYRVAEITDCIFYNGLYIKEGK